MTDQHTADEQLAALDIVERLTASVQHLHPSYGTVRAGLEWLRGHVEQRDRNRVIGQQFGLKRPTGSAFHALNDEQVGRLIRDAVHATGHTIVPQPGDEENERV